MLTVDGSTPVRRSSSRRRGFMRPQGTDFAPSARARESVLSLGSIAHLQYYFARTGLLDGKGGRFARRNVKCQTLDLSSLDPSAYSNPKAPGSDHDSSYASMGSSPELTAQTCFTSVTGNSMFESPVDEHKSDDEEYFSDDFEDEGFMMLPPTVSTYNHREKHIPKPPSVAELRADLTTNLDLAEKTLHEARDARAPEGLQIRIEKVDLPTDQQDGSSSRRPSLVGPAGWYELQGVNILDAMTMAIRSAKIYYTQHDRPDRLDAIKSEKQLRSELISVMDVLKRMAARNFAGGMRSDEFDTMMSWVVSVRDMLLSDEALEAEEIADRATWAEWVYPDGWEGREFEREEAFLRSMLKGSDIRRQQKHLAQQQQHHFRNDPPPSPSMPVPAPLTDEGLPPLPAWTPIDRTRPLSEQTLPTPFLAALSNGQRLVQLHNCAVRKSRRRFGAIPAFYANTSKPYRAADNLRWWMKAAELRWEVVLKADALGLQYWQPPNKRNDNPNANNAPGTISPGPEVWVEFEDAVLQWCRRVREEISAEWLQERQEEEEKRKKKEQEANFAS